MLRLTHRANPRFSQDLVPGAEVVLGRTTKYDSQTSSFSAAESGELLIPSESEKAKHCSRKQAMVRALPDGRVSIAALGMNPLTFGSAAAGSWAATAAGRGSGCSGRASRRKRSARAAASACSTASAPSTSSRRPRRWGRISWRARPAAPRRLQT